MRLCVVMAGNLRDVEKSLGDQSRIVAFRTAGSKLIIKNFQVKGGDFEYDEASGTLVITLKIPDGGVVAIGDSIST